MTEPFDNEAFVFVSYSHADRQRTTQLVDELERQGIRIWWDDKVELGSPWRRAIQDHLDRAVCTLIVWTTSSVDSDFVRSEASQHSASIPVKLDADARIPIGFTEYQYSDLTAWSGAPSRDFDRLVMTLRKFIERGPRPIDQWILNQPKAQVESSISATKDLRQVTQRLRSLAEVSVSTSKANEELRLTLAEIDKTYVAVNDGIRRFLAPGAQKADIDPQPYLELERDEFRAAVERGRGHCGLIALHYGRHGGLRDWLVSKGDAEQLLEADELFTSLSDADGDAFARMVAIADLLKNQSREIVNLLYAEQYELARARVKAARGDIAPLEEELAHAMRDLQEVRTDLGYPGNIP